MLIRMSVALLSSCCLLALACSGEDDERAPSRGFESAGAPAASSGGDGDDSAASTGGASTGTTNTGGSANSPGTVTGVVATDSDFSPYYGTWEVDLEASEERILSEGSLAQQDDWAEWKSFYDTITVELTLQTVTVTWLETIVQSNGEALIRDVGSETLNVSGGFVTDDDLALELSSNEVVTQLGFRQLDGGDVTVFGEVRPLDENYLDPIFVWVMR